MTHSAPWEPPPIESIQQELPLYEILAVLGRGGMGVVYLARQRSLKREVAIKVLPPGAAGDHRGHFMERFKAEAEAMARLNHPGIVLVHDAGETAAGLLYFVMEYVQGTNVQQMLAAAGRLPAASAHSIAMNVCEALAYAHSHGIIHRDIKPANIIVDTVGRVKVADFGLAKAMNDEKGFTATSMTMGTPEFVAPESLIDGMAVDGRADIYSLGVMLYQMLTGHTPRGAWQPASVEAPGVSPRFDPVIEKAIQHDRNSRYASAAELSDHLSGVLGSAAAPAAAGGAKFRSNAVVAGSFGVLAAAAMGAVFFWPKQPETNQAPAAKNIAPEDAASTPRREAITNKLGMKFLPVPGTKTLFCIHETRRKDYAAFAAVTPGLDEAWKSQMLDGEACGVEDDHPVVGVRWVDAKAFCAWLGAGDGKSYRLPTDAEWSIAAGLGEAEKPKAGVLPRRLSGKETTIFPWEGDYPPHTADRAGNYGDAAFGRRFPGKVWMAAYSDEYATTAPVMSFKPNKLGLYDMGGNVWEWCEDWFREETRQRVLRGGSFHGDERSMLLASYRHFCAETSYECFYGFRCVIETPDAFPAAAPP